MHCDDEQFPAIQARIQTRRAHLESTIPGKRIIAKLSARAKGKAKGRETGRRNGNRAR